MKSPHPTFVEGVSTGLNNIPVEKGRRLITTHIGIKNGFVNGGLLSIESKSTKDYHEEMTTDVFEEYFNQILDLIPEHSVIVLDNALSFKTGREISKSCVEKSRNYRLTGYT